MCAPVIVGEVRLLNVALICIVWAVGSSTTVARPVPGEGTGLGSSLAPERTAVKVIGMALATDDGNAKTAIIISAGETLRILTSISWFADFPRDPRRKKASFGTLGTTIA